MEYKHMPLKIRMIVHTMLALAAMVIVDVDGAYCPVIEDVVRPSALYCNNSYRRFELGIDTEDGSIRPPYPLYEQTWPPHIHEFIIGVFGMQEIHAVSEPESESTSESESSADAAAAANDGLLLRQTFLSTIRESLAAATMDSDSDSGGDSNAPSLHFDESTFTDKRNVTTQLVTVYWVDKQEFSVWINSSPFMQWFRSDDRLAADDNGYFMEILFVPIEDIETAHSQPPIQRFAELSKGSVNLALADQYFDTRLHAYWGSMIDRIPGSAFNAYRSDSSINEAKADSTQVCMHANAKHRESASASARVSASVNESDSRSPNGDNRPQLQQRQQWQEKRTRAQRIHVNVPHNMNVIRSGQDFSLANEEELRAYKNEMEPVLLAGMKYLRDHPIATNCMAMRFLYDRDRQQRKTTEETKDADDADTSAGYDLRSTAGFGYFSTIADLAAWSKSHPTHLAIFHKFQELAQRGKLETLYLWHEIYVVDYGFAEYVNCHRETGLLPWFS